MTSSTPQTERVAAIQHSNYDALYTQQLLNVDMPRWPHNRVAFGIRSALLASGVLLRVRVTVTRQLEARAKVLNAI